MSFETQIAIQAFGFPIVLSFIGCMILLTCVPKQSYLPPLEPTGLLWKNLIGTIFCSIGLVASDFWGRSILLEPKNWRSWTAAEPWMWMVWFTPALFILFGILNSFQPSKRSARPAAWPLVITSACLLLYWVMPIGKGYEDKLPTAFLVSLLSIIAIAWNAVALNTLVTSHGSRWSTLVLLAQAGGVSALVLQSYASLGVWSLTLAGTAIGVSLAGFTRSSTAEGFLEFFLAPVYIGLLVALHSILGLSQIYISETHPWWLLGILAFLPSIVCLTDLPFQRANPWLRVVIAASISAMILGIEIYWLESNKPDW